MMVSWSSCGRRHCEARREGARRVSDDYVLLLAVWLPWNLPLLYDVDNGENFNWEK